MAGWKRICCAIDLMDPSREALDTAADLAARVGAELTLATVQEPVPWTATEMLASGELVQRSAADLELALAAHGVELGERAGRPVETAILAGPAAAELARFAREGEFDLLVVGTHGRKGLQRAVLGSVAEGLVRRAHCPVLVVRQDLHSS